MKLFPFITLFAIGLIIIGCSKVDDPEPVNQEEVITTMLVTLKPISGQEVTLTSRDLDGDGPQAPFINTGGPLSANTTYNGTIVLLNETVSPAEVVTEEVKEEAAEHQFFYTVSGLADTKTTYSDSETSYPPNSGNYPVGIQFQLETGGISTGSINITLRHEPEKNAAGVLTGDITNAAGETDFTATFPVEVQ